jgi:HD-GYP domain-containing protein (c-di-GMP phosphodiesterase class II)
VRDLLRKFSRLRSLEGAVDVPEPGHSARRLGQALVEHHRATAEHSRRCALIARRVALRLGLDPIEVSDVALVALLHDVGKLQVECELLDYPGVLSSAQRARLCEHAADGGSILAATDGLEHLAPLVRATHEHFDGSGYPDGLRGGEIPLAARIVACADAYDAMSAARAYRPALPREEAMRRMHAGAGTQWDPAAVGALMAAVAPRFTRVQALA